MQENRPALIRLCEHRLHKKVLNRSKRKKAILQDSHINIGVSESVTLGIGSSYFRYRNQLLKREKKILVTIEIPIGTAIFKILCKYYKYYKYLRGAFVQLAKAVQSPYCNHNKL